jgi:pyruvate,orthophosphate dikinase
MGRIRWLLRVLGDADLAAAHENALRDVTRTVTTLMADPAADRRGLVHDVFALLHAHRFPYPQTVLDLISRIGSHALASSDPDLAETLVDEVLATDFAYPDFAGFTDEWALRTNPVHVESIRTWLRLVQADPVAAQPLLAALVVHLRLGGVSIPDSALFQRDVSALLATPIEPVYVQVVHLLRLLPVYFAEIGSEGRLRDVSTRLDEALQRRDPLCHFLRKQAHVECNAHLIDLIEEVARYWADGDRDSLRTYLPPGLVDSLDPASPQERGIHAVFAALAEGFGSVEAALGADPDTLHEALARDAAGADVDRERAELLAVMWHEVRRKYALDHADIVERLRAYLRLDPAAIAALADALDAGDHAAALDHALTLLEALQAIILTPGEIRAREDIYLKRHIAVGIPSMYGSYREDRLDAVGLTFRLQSLADSLAERCMDPDLLPDEGRARLRTLADWVRQLHRALRVEGYRAQGLTHSLGMLDEALASPATTDAQLLTVVHQAGRNLEVTIRARILDVYEEPVRRVVTRMIARGLLPGEGEPAVLRHSETVLRDIISASASLGRLDALISLAIRELGERVHAPAAVRPPLPAGAPDADRAVVHLPEAPDELGVVALGGKAFMLRQLDRMGLRVPPAFVVTTDLFRARHAVRADAAATERLRSAVLARVARLESETGMRFGDPRRPLLLSVRGGAPLSMPGMLATFLNVGMSPDVAEGFAAARGEWAAWDSYRRFIQSWGMAHAVARDDFDALIADAKRRRGVAHKAHLPADAMRALALDYRRLVADHGVAVEDDPVRQLFACIDLVHDSWDAEAARLYRGELHISDEWGTAVIVQAMVFGNLGPRAGSGVILTDAPERSSDIVSISGDYAVQSQGDDIVGGLVEARPITERQRAREARAIGASLESEFPAIHRTLASVARSLVRDHGLNYQEIEFTFEGDTPDRLFLLQTRDTVVATHGVVPAFLPSPALESARAAQGIGVSGGALSGRVACSMSDIDRIHERHPGEPVILLRPDTVPDDIALVLAAEGVLTALGGATSHAAVAAKRLGKTCVVGCRALEVDEHAGRARLGTLTLTPGDVLSISGLDGAVYVDAHPVAMVGIEGGHRW